MGREQRWAASGVVALLGVLWGAVGVWTVTEPYRWSPPSDDGTGLFVFAVGLLVLATTALWLVAGLVTVHRVAKGEWRWGPAAVLAGGAALLSAVASGAAWSAEDDLLTALFAFQTAVLVGFVGLLWVPPPRPAAPPGS